VPHTTLDGTNGPRWPPRRCRRRAAVLLVAALPPVLLSAWFAVLSATEGVWYPPEVWSGTIVWAGPAGLGLSLLVLPAPSTGRNRPAPPR
jgi:hypothetical protein